MKQTATGNQTNLEAKKKCDDFARGGRIAHLVDQRKKSRIQQRSVHSFPVGLTAVSRKRREYTHDPLLKIWTCYDCMACMPCETKWLRLPATMPLIQELLLFHVGCKSNSLTIHSDCFEIWFAVLMKSGRWNNFWAYVKDFQSYSKNH